MTDIAGAKEAIRNVLNTKAGTNIPANAALSEFAHCLNSARGTSGGNSRVVVVDLDGTVLYDQMHAAGDTIDLAAAVALPEHPRLTFNCWSCNMPLSGGHVLTVAAGSDVCAGPIYDVDSGKLELYFDYSEYTMSDDGGEESSSPFEPFYLRLDYNTGVSDVDWGDGSPMESVPVNGSLEHIYPGPGNYRVLCTPSGTELSRFFSTEGGRFTGCAAPSGVETVSIATDFPDLRFVSLPDTCTVFVGPSLDQDRAIILPPHWNGDTYLWGSDIQVMPGSADNPISERYIVIPYGATVLPGMGLVQGEYCSRTFCPIPSTITNAKGAFYGVVLSSRVSAETMGKIWDGANMLSADRLDMGRLGSTDTIHDGAFLSCDVKKFDFAGCSSLPRIEYCSDSDSCSDSESSVSPEAIFPVSGSYTIRVPGPKAAEFASQLDPELDGHAIGCVEPFYCDPGIYEQCFDIIAARDELAAAMEAAGMGVDLSGKKLSELAAVAEAWEPSSGTGE